MDQDHVTIVCLVVLWNLLYVMLVSKGSLTEVSNKFLTTSNELIYKFFERFDQRPESVDCEWNWSSWTQCDPGYCGNPRNTQDRYKLITHAPQFGGATCDFAVGRSVEASRYPEEEGRIQYQECIPTIPCHPVDDEDGGTGRPKTEESSANNFNKNTESELKTADKDVANKYAKTEHSDKNAVNSKSEKEYNCDQNDDNCKAKTKNAANEDQENEIKTENVNSDKETLKYRNGHVTSGLHMLGWPLKADVLDNSVHVDGRKIPHNVEIYENIAHKEPDWHVQMFANTNELATNLSVALGGGIILQPGFRNYTKGVNTRTGEYYIVTKLITLDYIAHREPKDLFLNEDFKNTLTSLSPVFSYLEYIRVLDKFGTHYYARAPRGGLLAVLYGFDRCILQGRVNKQRRLRRKDLLVDWVKHALQQGYIQINSIRKRESMVGTFIIKGSVRGGSLNASQNVLGSLHHHYKSSWHKGNSLQEWLPTVRDHPHIIRLDGYNEIRFITQLAESRDLKVSDAQRALIQNNLKLALDQLMQPFNRSLCRPCPKPGALLHISFDFDKHRKGRYGCFCEDQPSHGGPCYLDSMEFKKISTYLAIFLTCLWLSYKWGIDLDVISRPLNMSRDFLLKQLGTVHLIEWEPEAPPSDNNNTPNNDYNKRINITL